MFDWICALTADCLTCQNSKPKPKYRNEVPLEQWQNETVRFRTIQIDHKGPFHPTSASNVHCLLVIDAFSRFLMVYPIRNTTAVATITAVEKWILSFGIPQSIILDRGVAFINTEFSNWTKELGITLRSRAAYSPWTNGKTETQNQRIARYWRNFFNDAGNNCSSLAPKFAFAHNTSVNHATGKPHMKSSLAPNHKLLCHSSCDFIGKNTSFAVQIFVKTFLFLIARSVDNLLQPQLSPALLDENEPSNKSIPQLRTMPRTDSTVTRLSQSLQAGTPSRDRTESTRQKPQTRFYAKPKTSTAKAWTLYRY